MSWKIDNSHSEVTFKVRHMMISNVRGAFERFSGDVSYDQTNPANTSVDVRIETASINTNDEKRDAHLKSADFFNAEEYPYIEFRSTKVEMVDDSHAKMTGDLTITAVTRPVTLDVEYIGMEKAPWGVTNAGFSARTRLNRKDFGLTWNVALESGGWLVGDSIDISIELELSEVPNIEPELVAA